MGAVPAVYHPLACDKSAPKRARAFVDGRLVTALDGSTGGVDVRDDAAVVVSELVTNAVQAGATVLCVSMEWGRDVVRISVYDDAEGMPTPREPGTGEARGRGLAVVQTLATSWGFDTNGSVGKWVFANVSLNGLAKVADLGGKLRPETASAARPVFDGT